MTRVLLCEDSSDIRALLTYQLEDHGVEVVEESAGCEGCEHVAAEHEVDAIILDLNITGGDMGVIRRLTNCAPVVVFSGYPAYAKEAECLEAGAAAYVEKRAEASELAAAIHRVARSA